MLDGLLAFSPSPDLSPLLSPLETPISSPVQNSSPDMPLADLVPHTSEHVNRRASERDPGLPLLDADIADLRTPQAAQTILHSPTTGTSFVPSSPWVHNSTETTPQVKRRKSKAASQKTRVATITVQNAARDEAREDDLRAAIQANITERLRQEHNAAEAKVRCFDAILDTLKHEGYTWGDFVEWISRPSSDRRLARWEGLFRKPDQVEKILDLWAWKGPPRCRTRIQDWGVKYIGWVVSNEAAYVTRTGPLQTRTINFDDSFVRLFELSAIHDRIRAMCPSMTAILRMFCTTPRQRKDALQPAATERERFRANRQLERTETVSTSQF